MGTFTPDVAITVPDVEAAAEYYQKIFGLGLGHVRAHCIEMIAGPFRFYLTDEEPATTAMFAFTSENVESTVKSILESGGEEIGRKGSEIYVRDRYGLPICIEAVPHIP